MTTNLFGERFYSLRRPAWHSLGVVSQEELGAVDAYSRIVPFTISLERMFAEIDGERRDTKVRAIYRHPTPDDPDYRLLGTVGSEYRLIDPLRLCELYDENVRYPIETMGALGEGSTLFFSTRLPSFDVKKDEIESYMLVDSPYSGNAAIRVRVTPVRVVCQNTLIVARQQATESYAIRHDGEAERDLGIWLGGIIARAEGRIKNMREMFEAMSNKRVTPVDVEALLVASFPDPKLPDLEHPNPAFVERQVGSFEARKRYAEKSRETVRQLFEGAGVGMDREATAGTAFGLFNAVCERAQYASGIRTPAGLWDTISGTRSTEIERAFSAIWNFTTMPALEDAVLVPAKPRRSRGKKVSVR